MHNLVEILTGSNLYSSYQIIYMSDSIYFDYFKVWLECNSIYESYIKLCNFRLLKETFICYRYRLDSAISRTGVMY